MVHVSQAHNEINVSNLAMVMALSKGMQSIITKQRTDRMESSCVFVFVFYFNQVFCYFKGLTLIRYFCYFKELKSMFPDLKLVCFLIVSWETKINILIRIPYLVPWQYYVFTYTTYLDQVYRCWSILTKVPARIKNVTMGNYHLKLITSYIKIIRIGIQNCEAENISTKRLV